MSEAQDCLIIGAGPAGLTAAIYLVRFNLKIRVVDAGGSRCATIPSTRNHAGYPGGIGGAELLSRMRRQAQEFGVFVKDALIEKLRRDGDLFVAVAGDERIAAHSVLLATGIVNNRPAIAPDVHDAAVARGLLRYCPICDGYEVTDKRVGIIGTQTHGFNEAMFIRMYTKDVTIIAPMEAHRFAEQEESMLQSLGVEMIDGPCAPLRIDGHQIVVPVPKRVMKFDSIYPALGSVIRSELAVQLGADASQDGCLVVDDHQRTSIPGLYAAGDVVKGLDQISHAMGEAGVAATTIRNDLAEIRALVR
jgi:thioredoxin reductase (NADPH)